MSRFMKMVSVLLATAIGGCGAPLDRTEETPEGVGTDESALISNYWGFWHTPQTGQKILATWSDWNPYYCWVVDSGELQAIAITNYWGKNVNNSDLTYIAYNRPGSSSVYCPWPNGMFVANGAVYLIQGMTRTSYGWSCHIISNEQVAHHGGWDLVWQPELPGDQMKFYLASYYQGDCTW